MAAEDSDRVTRLDDTSLSCGGQPRPRHHPRKTGDSLKSIEQRSLHGTLLAALSLGLFMGQSLLLVPVLLRSWGDQRYGAWLALSAAVATITSLDVGHQTFLGGEFNTLFHTNHALLRRVLASGLRIALVFGVVEVLAAVGLALGGIAPALLGISAATASEQRLPLALVLMVALWVIPGSVGGIVVRLYLPAGRFTTSQWWGIAARLLQTAGVVVVALAGGGLLAAGVTVGVLLIVYGTALFAALRKEFGALWPSWDEGSWTLGFANVSRSLVLTGASWLTQVQGSVLLLIVSGVLGVGAVAAYGTVRTLSNGLLQGVQVIYAPLLPEMVRFRVTGEHAKLSHVLSASWLTGVTATGIGALLSLPVMPWLYARWTLGRIVFDWPLYLLLVLSVCVRTLGAPLINFLAGTNHLRAQGVMAAVQVAVVCAMAFGFSTARLGLAGIGWAVLAGEVVGSLIIPVGYVATDFRRRGGTFPWSSLLYGVCSVGAVAGTFALWRSNVATPAALIGGLGMIVGVAVAQWRSLPSEVTRRLLAMFRSPLQGGSISAEDRVDGPGILRGS